MSITTLIIVNIVLSAAAIGGLALLGLLAHRLPSLAPHRDEHWGIGGDPWVASDPLPLHQVARHEADRAVALAT